MTVEILLEREKFKKKIENGYGNFASVEEHENEIVLTVDIIRSIPLFYQVTNNVIYVSDYAEKIQEKTHASLLELNVNEFLRTGYVTENETIYNEIYQVLPGQRICISKTDGHVSQEFYFELSYTCDSAQTQEQLTLELDETMMLVFQDVIKHLNGRTALLPLSGGCDSRIVATMLKRLGYEDVICFSYGAKDNFEAKRSKEIANILGYKWLFVEYTSGKWKKYYESNAYEDFLKFSTRGSGIGCVQAIIAIMELKDKGLVPNDAVVIPGHTLDVLAGSHLPFLNNKQIYDKQYFVDEMIHQHYMQHKKRGFNIIKWSGYLPAKMSVEEFVNNAFKWEWKNRQSKFIANDVRAYEYAGFSWDLPLWDRRLCEFWMKVPYKYLYKRKLQYLYMEQVIDPIIGLEEKYDYSINSASNSKASIIKRFVVKLFPWLSGIRGCFIQYKSSSNAFYSHYSYLQYCGLMWKYGAQFNLNSIVADKYISLIRKQIKKD